MLQFVPLSFDVSVWETFMALACGATLCLAPPGSVDSADSLAEGITATRSDVAFLTPAVLALVDPPRVPTLTRVLTGGDRVPPELRDRWRGWARFVPVYGPTEGTIVQTWGECPPDQVGPTPIGQPIEGIRMYVLDRNLEPTPLGAVGEVYVGGLAVGRGYRHRPGATAERWLPDPFAGDRGARMYRTGDLVRRRPDGEFIFVGRADKQVKIRGFRVELGEVEAALARQLEVGESLALVEDQPHGSQLVGYVVPVDAGGAPGLPDVLRERLRTQLPHHLVPAQVHVVPFFPRTLNGKVDTATLQAMAGGDPELLTGLLRRLDTLSDREAEQLLGQPNGPGGPR